MEKANEGWSASEWRQWPVLIPSLAGVFLCAVHGYSLGVMIGPLEQEFGWTRAQISTGPMITAFIALFMSPVAGLAIDRFGPRRIGLFGVFFYCCALASLSTVTASITSWWLLWVLMAMANMFVLPTVWMAAINSLFSKNRGKALAIALCGTGITAAVVPALTNLLIEMQGWRQAYVSLAAICFMLIAPLVFFLFRGALDMQREAAAASGIAAETIVLPGVSASEGVRSVTFLKMTAAILVFSTVGSSLTINAVPIIVAQGFDRAAAAGIAGLVGIGSIIGRLGGGYLLDRFDAKKVAAFSAASPMIAVSIFLAVDASVWPMGLAALILGLSVGAEVDACAYLVARHFGMRSFGAMFGTINGMLIFTNGLAPIAANYIYDVTRSYDGLLWALLPMSVVGSGLFLMLGRYPVFENSETPAK